MCNIGTEISKICKQRHEYGNIGTEKIEKEGSISKICKYRRQYVKNV
jgi:hypothetical protein